MIRFDCDNIEDYNYLIHGFLTGVLGDEPKEEALDVFVRDSFPEYIYQNHREKCIQSLYELLQWSADPSMRFMHPFQELVLYLFLVFLSDFAKEFDDHFEEHHFDKKSKEIIDRLASIYEEEAEAEEMPTDFRQILTWDPAYYVELLFFDLDFLSIPEWQRYLGPSSALNGLESLGIDFYDYLELLPHDLQRAYGTKPFHPFRDLAEFLRHLEYRLNRKNLAALFWSDGSAVSMEAVGSLICSLLQAYFHAQNLEIERTDASDTVSFHIASGGTTCTLDIVAMPDSELTDAQRNKVASMAKENPMDAFLCLVCWTKEQVERAEALLKEHVPLKHQTMGTTVYILDCRKRTPGLE